MFRSKVSSLLRNITNKNSHCNGHTNLLQNALCSTNTLVAETDTSQIKDIPDKLYKKIEIEVRGNDQAVLESYGQFAVTAASHLDINVSKHFAVKKPVHEKLTVLKSAFVHKKHRVQYETRTYYRYLELLKLTGSTADTFLEYIQRNLPEGVAMKVTKVELQTLPENIKEASSQG
ncbi:mitochondrial ribosomal protein S10 [Ptiloglossa arizonensis]|uniref:mitochondrial ribosomal protein S10 n=1 Tax=Ptiloglossa arizonensis TaxID=3350558 RepID=UPI003FA03C33